MKKIGLLTCILVLCSGCATQQDQTKDTMYKDGTIKTIASGYGGDFEVETTLKDDKIQDIIVKENNETPSIGGVAIEQMIQSMKEKNSYDVDIVSGATKTSVALKEAVLEAMEKAKK